MIDIQGIKEALPHRYPMLLVDRVLEVSEDTIVAIKNVTINEPFFNGHFPQYLKTKGNLSYMLAWIRLSLRNKLFLVTSLS